jgi:hypothetical protein
MSENDLQSEGVRALLEVTKNQFKFWGEELKKAKTAEQKIHAGDLMDYWFIMASLAEHGPDFKARKKDLYDSIPNLAESTIKRHAGRAKALGFIQAIQVGNTDVYQLTPAGQKAVASTLLAWVREFGKVQRKYFPDIGDDGEGTESHEDQRKKTP